MAFIRGMRDRLSKYVDTSTDISIDMSISGSSVYDFCCFGVDSNGKLSDDRYMIFYNQTSSPNHEISYQAGNNTAKFNLNLSRLPSTIDKLIFTVSIDGNGTMGEISNHTLSVSQNGTASLTMNLSGADFKQEKAIISIEIYRKDEWRISAVANGFNGGLSALLTAYGGTEIESAPQPVHSSPNQTASNPVPVIASAQQRSIPTVPKPVSGGGSPLKTEQELAAEVMGKISLSKDKVNLEKHVVNLSKTVVNLSKKSGTDLGSTKAEVVVALDYSGSMSTLYKNGTVQRTINRLVPLGLTFDDNGSIDVYLFQNDYRKMNDLNLSNYENYISNVVKRSGYRMGGTNYAPVLRAIIEKDAQYNAGFLGLGTHRKAAQTVVDDEKPTFILFITDGANFDTFKTDEIIRKSSEMNVFIQFIGIGNERFDYLMKLDDMPGRKRDNTGFSKMKSLENASDEVLYTNILEQFSLWLKGMQ